MQDTFQPEKSEKMYTILLSIILVIIVILAVLFFVLTNDQQNGTTNGQQNGDTKKYQTLYYNIEPEDAYALINQSENGEFNLIVNDIRQLEPHGCTDCEFKRGHLPDAVRLINTHIFYETENVTLICSRNGELGAEFSQDLVGYVYGEIYNLKGGWEAWNSAGFIKETGLD